MDAVYQLRKAPLLGLSLSFFIGTLCFVFSLDLFAKPTAKKSRHVDPVFEAGSKAPPKKLPGFEERCSGRFCFRFPKALSERADALMERLPWLESGSLALLGGKLPPRTLISLSATRKQFQRQLPHGVRVPQWAAAVAFPRLYYIVMGPSSTQRIEARLTLLAHEYSHLALGHLTRFRRLPTWFVEGLADLQALRVGPLSPRLGGRPLSLEEIDRGFPSDHRRASSAYRQSRAFVSFLYNSGTPEDFHRLLALLRQGKPLKASVRQVYGVSLKKMEGQWRTDWRYRNLVVPLITSGLFLWILAAGLLMAGYIKKRRAQKKRMRDYEDEDDDFGPVYSYSPTENAPPRTPYRPPIVWILSGVGMTLLATGILRSLWPHTRVSVIFGAAGVVVGLLMAALWWTRGGEDGEGTDDGEDGEDHPSEDPSGHHLN
jgi:hypothetical protein